MKLNSVFLSPIGYKPPLRDGENCLPQDLAELLVYDLSFWLRVFGGDWPAPLSESGIRRLIELVYFASMYPDEGRFPRFKVATSPGSGSSSRVAHFDPIVVDS